MKERLQQLLNKEQLTPVRFAELVGVQRSSVSHILSGRNNPSLDFIQKILLKFPQISSDWLINGIGEIYRDMAAANATKTPELFGQIKEEDPAPYFSQTARKMASNPESTIESLNKAEQDPIDPAKGSFRGEADTPSEIERIVVFYRDRTFREYHPE